MILFKFIDNHPKTPSLREYVTLPKPSQSVWIPPNRILEQVGCMASSETLFPSFRHVTLSFAFVSLASLVFYLLQVHLMHCCVRHRTEQDALYDAFDVQVVQWCNKHQPIGMLSENDSFVSSYTRHIGHCNYTTNRYFTIRTKSDGLMG